MGPGVQRVGLLGGGLGDVFIFMGNKQARSQECLLLPTEMPYDIVRGKMRWAQGLARSTGCIHGLGCRLWDWVRVKGCCA